MRTTWMVLLTIPLFAASPVVSASAQVTGGPPSGDQRGDQSRFVLGARYWRGRCGLV